MKQDQYFKVSPELTLSSPISHNGPVCTAILSLLGLRELTCCYITSFVLGLYCTLL